MKGMYFRTVQKLYPKSNKVNIPRDISEYLQIVPGDTVVYSINTHGFVEIRKAMV